MRAARTNRLARRTDQRSPDGVLTKRAQRAWTILITAAESGDRTAIEALWAAWLRDPRYDTWEHVSRWCTTADVLAAAVDAGRDAGSRAAIGAYCVRNDLLPVKAVDRASFFALTGQQKRYQALDPDGKLLARAYRGAAEETREALRRTVIGVGRQHLVRVITERSDRIVTSAEAGYLADAGEWERLWRLMPAMPLAGAVRAARLIPDWRPAGDAARGLFERLAAADPDRVTEPVNGLVARFKVWGHHCVSFAPDNSELAIRSDKGIAIHSLPDGRRRHRYPGTGYHNPLAMGGGGVVHCGGGSQQWLVSRCAPGQLATVLPPGVYYRTLGRVPGGFVVGSGKRLRFGTTDGRWSRAERYRELPGKWSHGALLEAADPVRGHLALRSYSSHGQQDMVILDAELRPVARGWLPAGGDWAFCGPDRLLGWWWGYQEGDGRIEMWRRDGTRLERVASRTLDVYGRPTPVPAHRQVVICRPGRLVWLDADTLTEIDRPAGLDMMRGWFLEYSVDGALVATWTGRRTEVHDLRLHQLAALAAQPLRELPSTALETVAGLANHELAPHVREVVELLRSGLEYRFGPDTTA
ncbi:hypothetical protein [Actinocrispum sp. NPDC049592]|uniref:hypothetical protein n=1 Tax=Actinocrispum sp. NPDC049592 TaxID=3154835 RepID=UPI003421DE85